MGHALRLSADLPHQIAGHEVRQNEGGDEYWTDDSLSPIQGKVPGGPDQWEQSGKDTFERQLHQLDRADASRADAEGDQFCSDWNPAVAEKSVAEGHVHNKTTCIILRKKQIAWRRGVQRSAFSVQRLVFSGHRPQSPP
jgi:hypothetical protein